MIMSSLTVRSYEHESIDAIRSRFIRPTGAGLGMTHW